MWTIGLTVEIKLCFQIFPVLSSENLRFRDGLVWMEGLIEEIRLRFQTVSPALCGRCPA